MIYPGQQVHVTLSCLECGKAMENRMPVASAFYMVCCSQADCGAMGILLLIEKVSGVILWTSSVGGNYDGDKWIPLFPMQADRDGKQVWPKPESPKVEEPHPTQNRHRFFSRPDILECGVCGRGIEEVIHF